MWDILITFLLAVAFGKLFQATYFYTLLRVNSALYTRVPKSARTFNLWMELSFSTTASAWGLFWLAVGVACAALAWFALDRLHVSVPLSGVLIAWVGMTIALFPPIWLSKAKCTRILHRVLGEADAADPCCEHCGYNLRGLRDSRCPECGTPFHAMLIRLRQEKAERKRAEEEQNPQ